MRPDDEQKLLTKLETELRPRLGIQLRDYGEKLGVALMIGTGASHARLECVYPSTMEFEEILLDLVEHFRTRKSRYALPDYGLGALGY